MECLVKSILDFNFQLLDDDGNMEVQQEGDEGQPGDGVQVDRLASGRVCFDPFFLQLSGDDGDVELQQVIQIQLEAGQGPGLSTQEFENRMFLN